MRNTFLGIIYIYIERERERSESGEFDCYLGEKREMYLPCAVENPYLPKKSRDIITMGSLKLL